MHFQKPILGTQLDWSNPLNDGCVMHLGMLEGSGDKVYDLSMNRNHGILHNFAYPPTVDSGWNPGWDGVGLTFDGSSDYIDCGNNASLNITNEMTLLFILKRSVVDATTNQGIIKKDEAGGFVLSLSYGGADNKINYISPGVGVAEMATPISDTNWHSIAVSINEGENVMNFYLDGVLSSTGATIGVLGVNTSPVILGYRTGYLKGSISDVRIYNRALSAKEVLDYYINPYSVYLDEDD